MTKTANPNNPALIAWQVRENKRSGKPIWTRVGAAWHHRNGPGLSIELDSLPFEGRLVLLPPKAAVPAEGGAA